MALKGPVERYSPGNLPDSPDGLIEFLYDELPRIATAMNEFPVGINVREEDPAVPVELVPVEFRLFEGETPLFDLPGGSWDIPLGEWTCPASGLYTINAISVVAPFGAGNKDYAALLRIYVDDVETLSSGDVGQDNFDLTSSIALSTFITRESVIRATITLVHDQFTGTTTVTSFMSIVSSALE